MASESFAKGNEAFVCEDYETAEEHYTKAIELDASRDEYFVARSHARTKLEKYQDAISDASKALEINNKNAKAHFRKGVALFNIEDYVAAYESFTAAQALDESVKNISTWLRKCEAELDLKKKTSEMTSTDSKKAEANAGSSDEQTKAQTSTQPSAPVIPMPSGPKTKYDWYQTETHVVVTILIKNVKKEDLKTDIQEKQLSVSINLPSGSEYALHLDLLHPIAPDQSQVKILQTKIEIKLKKVEGIRWNKLEGEPEENIKYFKPEPATVATMKYPSSSHFNRDWDKLVADIKKEEKNEKLEGDAALNQLFQQIYAEGSDDVKKAMNKSFLESGGTVLSTNWQEIASKKTEIKPPDGMEYKTFPSNSQ